MTRKRVDVQTTADVVDDDAPVVQVVGRILTQAMRDRASDVHIEPSELGIRVRYRIDGALKEVLTLPSSIGVGLVSRIKIMAGMNIVERRRPQDGQLRTEIDGREVDVRVATLATIWGEKCVLRLLDRTRSVLHFGELGMPDESAETYSNFIRAPFGMVLCAGPTGSGKTTTLYATLSEISDSTRNVMTIEDPVEYVFPTINQIQTNEQAGVTFATGLPLDFATGSRCNPRRRDPRCGDCGGIAVQSALTGHLVLSSSFTRRIRCRRSTDFSTWASDVFPHRFVGHWDRRPTARSPDLPVLHNRLQTERRGASVLRRERWPGEDRLCPWRRLQLLQRHRIPRADRGL